MMRRHAVWHPVFWGAFGGSLALDQATKAWARAALRGQRPRVVIAGFWDFVYSENPGSAFSLFRHLEGARFVFIAISLAALAAVLVYLGRRPALAAFHALALGLVAGGAAGNLVDRLATGRVVDFIHWHWHARSWPVFNIADAALVGGLVALALAGLPRKPRST